VDGEIKSEEPLNQVSYLFWKKEFLDVVKERTKKIKKQVKYSSELEEKIFSELNRLQPDVDITPKMHIAEDLGLDSLDVAELITFLSVNFDVGDVHPEDIETVQDILDIAAGKKKIKREEPLVTYSWPEEKRPFFEFAKGDTIGETFLNSCDRMKNFAAVADDMLGVFSYKKLKLSALVLSMEIEKMEGKNIGVLLPSSVGAYIVILAVILAKKVPIMLNWTSGPRYLNHMVKITSTKTIISSWRFLERISNVEFGELTKKLRLLEDIKKEIPMKEKIKAKFLSLKRAKSLMKSLNLKNVKESDTAVILFTSGTEANPKGVVLTHKNILSNQRSAISCISVKKEAIMYGILPPFHSFGFSVAGVLPILFGMRIAYSPDPTDSYTLAEGIARWRITILCAAPSFLKGILQAATKEQLKTMHLFVTGAEKAPKELFDRVAKLGKGKKLIEGYGITECSPVLTIVREEDEAKGVGKLIPGVELIIVHPETRKVLDSKQEGEICVKGDNVFSGYLEKPKKSPFLEVKGEKWYCTGDLGHLDKEGNLILSGRLKRFVKIGGEMVSLVSVEEIVLKELMSKGVDLGEGAPIAVCALEKTEGKSELILFTTLFLEIGDVNNILRKAECSRLIKISRIKRINRIPLMGSGKVDYRFLQKMLER
jgi:long-chain-fatty-acid--[acyl-carrier-protein] ligase